MMDVTFSHITLAKASHMAKPNVTEMEKCNLSQVQKQIGNIAAYDDIVCFLMHSFPDKSCYFFGVNLEAPILYIEEGEKARPWSLLLVNVRRKMIPKVEPQFHTQTRVCYIYPLRGDSLRI